MIEIGDKLAVIAAGTLIIFMKLVVIVVAYKIIKLGYDLLLKGITGSFQFTGEVAGHKADLKSASPGLLFVLLGCVTMVLAFTTKFPQTVKKDTTESQRAFVPAPKPETSHYNIDEFLKGAEND